MYALFIDFKAAFDNVNREKMWEYLRRKGVDAYLVTKMEEIYEETVNKVRMNGIETESFYTNRGVRQGCPLSPVLFAAYLGDIDEMFRKAHTGEVVVGKKKVSSLAYADDLVIVVRKTGSECGKNENSGIWEESKIAEGRVGMEREED
ncbi:reverse transcriptase domain-containing protein [Enterobacter cloacae complex sp. 2DZ2F20B]|uniref:reverse transcriptase domain-containing protein n=1 Tax=Enterobacter cloacae complex sp. 2DZ2F20B TaxID=2511993 RepID=UPI0021068F8D|nr:reverse transcriptase domain-containing protein [Enterobacter cloacae complex sp. 2DZ2F20B]